jgi:hypothetical protein
MYPPRLRRRGVVCGRGTNPLPQPPDARGLLPHPSTEARGTCPKLIPPFLVYKPVTVLKVWEDVWGRLV